MNIMKNEMLEKLTALPLECGAFKANVIKTENGKTYFAESEFRSAPYFDILIDGITRGADVTTTPAA